ncbi:predicted protein [Postia placenta Mad-698-R]|uniref:RlpA-like protein double-psi beta-barrel domain-containing protein n=1 Tax=Postia placenta MAD-698-R-SB12 TaxID=670580 RepID=A0A1X6MRX8_9APHY|nr:hypothetical protein POSPLADRAFT_1151812 [Postia placenta MAD-698-R-SB12]EED80011.1 predicted protein [Postia placenta Mad-698-R]OSX58986.1 hypothetical protein POSPLADRAFT_1151812 [Postia placenta MAD-698-R-SB12]
MSRFAVLAIALSIVVAAVFGTPVADVDLEKRVDHTGQATWYDVGLGACGYTDVASSPVVAISHDIYGSGGNCNQWMQITNKANGKVEYGKTRDECEGCDATSIDLSSSLFESLGAPLSEGVLQVEWHFMAKGWSP